MRNRIVLGLLIVLCSAGMGAWAQDQPTPPRNQKLPDFYKLDVALNELDNTGRKITTRNYTMMVSSERGNNDSRVKIGNRVPVVTQGKDGVPTTTYIDVGLSVQCRYLFELDAGPEFTCNFEVSSLVPQQENPDSRPGAPIMRQLSANGVAVTPLGKTTLFNTIEDPNTGKRFQFEVTTTRAK